MSSVTPQLVKELRDRTFAGFGDCKAALEEANGDIDMAADILRKKGIAKSAKRAENETKEGKIAARVHGNKIALVSVGCETDFVARNEYFTEMVERMLDAVQAGGDIMAHVEQIKGDYAMKMGENIRVLAAEELSGEETEVYIHTNGKVAAITMAKAGTSHEALRQVAMHVTATNPEVLSPDQVSADLIAKEMEIQLSMMKEDPKNAGKPQDILEKIIAGKMSKFKEENALLTQPFVMDPSKTVENVAGVGMITGFKRYAI